MFQATIIRSPDEARPALLNFFELTRPSFFQGLDFLRLLYKTKGFNPFIILLEQNNKLVATLSGAHIREGSGLKSWFSQRTVIYGYPATAPSVDKAVVVGELLKTLKKITRGSLFTQFRNDAHPHELDKTFQHHGFRWRDRLNLIKPIQNLDEARKSLSESRRRQIKSSLKNGLRIIESPDKEQVRDFYRHMQCLYKTKVRKPLPPFSFFERFHQLSGSGNFNGRIILCEYEGKVVGGILCPFTPGASIYEWYVCGQDEEYSPAKVYPSVMATWAAMQTGHRLGCTNFDFMGLGIPGRPYGVRDFKARFHGEWVNYGRWSRINNPALYSIAELGYNVLRLLKKV